ncbi:phosphatidylcholine/phosphatidylserine synthase [Paenibacillus sp. J2TS4]|uniref:CDP-alcohol phosphatidyltransferase family protein n=1 Tax=Paenibacillus sp. J2TS4 TaxID=2807194 RepID=UPI001BCF7591|nr:CDP-alcohol phosphatidyltransferase family protein [Paenibacillus sp. J2TS4]
MIIELIPLFFTTGSLSAGVLSLIHVFEGYTAYAVLFVMLAAVINGLGCYMTAKMQLVNEFGKELRSLSELISFGAAPAMILYVVVLHQLDAFALGIIITSLFPICGALRLARDNIQTTPGGYYVGLPVPIAGCMLAMLALLGTQLDKLFLALAVVLLSYLMISTFKIPAGRKVKSLPDERDFLNNL